MTRRLTYKLTGFTDPSGDAMGKVLLYPGRGYDEQIPHLLADYFGQRGIACRLRADASGAMEMLVARAEQSSLERLLDMAASARLTWCSDDEEPLSRASAVDWYKVSRGATRDTAIGSLIRRAKYKSDVLAGRDLGIRLAEFAAFHPNYSQADVVVGVHSAAPLALSLAREVAEELGIPCVPGRCVLGHGRGVPKAKGLARGDKSRICENDVKLNYPTQLPSRPTVLLVDDVWSTGSTMQTYARACHSQLGAGTVYALVAACTDRNAPPGARDEI